MLLGSFDAKMEGRNVSKRVGFILKGRSFIPEGAASSDT